MTPHLDAASSAPKAPLSLPTAKQQRAAEQAKRTEAAQAVAERQKALLLVQEQRKKQQLAKAEAEEEQKAKQDAQAARAAQQAAAEADVKAKARRDAEAASAKRVAAARAERTAGATRGFSASPVAGGSPSYPSSYDDGRHGRVTVNCLITVGGAPSGCRVVASEGGIGFNNSVLGWLRGGGVRFQPILRNGEPHAEEHSWSMSFEP